MRAGGEFPTFQPNIEFALDYKTNKCENMKMLKPMSLSLYLGLNAQFFFLYFLNNFPIWLKANAGEDALKKGDGAMPSFA